MESGDQQIVLLQSTAPGLLENNALLNVSFLMSVFVIWTFVMLIWRKFGEADGLQTTFSRKEKTREVRQVRLLRRPLRDLNVDIMLTGGMIIYR